jgi:hypothetical protein
VKPTWRPRRNHPQIVAVYNRGDTDDGQLWIAMQFVDVWLTATGSAMATRAYTAPEVLSGTAFDGLARTSTRCAVGQQQRPRRCDDGSPATLPHHPCIASVDRYAFKTVARQLGNTQQQLAAPPAAVGKGGAAEGSGGRWLRRKAEPSADQHDWS